MFGVVPKTIWQKTNPADENNLCSWAMRCMLAESGNRLILIDNGIGNKQDAKFLSYYYLHGNDTLESSLKKYGFSKDDVTDVFLTHLHFDHCGGSIEFDKQKEIHQPAFKNATFWSNEEHWKWATEPNPREKASFLKENILPIKESGQLRFIEKEWQELIPGFRPMYTRGHTDAMMLPFIEVNGRTVVFMADLIPSAGHIPLPYVMGYDTRPLLTMDEKSWFLKEAVDKDLILFFEHDPEIECCTLQQTERGPRLKEKFKLEDLF